MDSDCRRCPHGIYQRRVPEVARGPELHDRPRAVSLAGGYERARASHCRGSVTGSRDHFERRGASRSGCLPFLRSGANARRRAAAVVGRATANLSALRAQGLRRSYTAASRARPARQRGDVGRPGQDQRVRDAGRAGGCDRRHTAGRRRPVERPRHERPRRRCRVRLGRHRPRGGTGVYRPCAGLCHGLLRRWPHGLAPRVPAQHPRRGGRADGRAPMAGSLRGAPRSGS